MKRAVDGNLLEVSEAPAAGPVVSLHQHVRLERATEPSRALACTTSQRGDLAVVLGQEGDDPIRVSVVDGAQ